jgi:ribosomal protein S18 acetylase RimI-like enzyme
MNSLPTVVTLFPEQYDEAAVILGRAFVNDPPTKAILPDITDPEVRARHIADLFRVALRIQRSNGQPVFGVLERGRVIAAAIVEGAGFTSGSSMLITGLGGLPRMVRAVGWGGTMRGINLMSVLADNHPHEPHIYLNVLGVDPRSQRGHCGTALLAHLRELAAARTEITGVYLETATEENVAYYSARGYEVIGEIFPIGVRMWRMFQRKRAS